MTKTISIKEFVETQWADYASYDNERSIPHVMDGLKTTQRKALYTATKLPKGDKPMRVSQFASKASEQTSYHHGEKSMEDTIVKLAQDYPGTNNYPFLLKDGQFGSRLSGEASSSRYIHTKLHTNFDKLFLKEDQEIVNYLVDDGQQIEPEFFIPVVPTLLLNGATGIGNGFNSKILTYSLESIVKACKEMIKHGKVKTPLIPFFNGWNGKVEKNEGQITLTGVIDIIHSTKLVIKELPPTSKYNNEKYKKILNKLADDGIIKSYENKSTEDKWEWIVHVPRNITALPEADLLELFKLVQKTTENIVAWGMDSNIPMTFDSPEQLIEYWFAERLKLYQKSIDHQIQLCKADIIASDLKQRFIKWCLKNDFRKFTKKEFIDNSVAGVKNLTPEIANDFVGMAMYRITTDEVEKLLAQIDQLVDTLETLEKLTPQQLMERNLKIN